ncbi:heavy-metal-associated domain-containing protein [Candidatus Pacearchaeota archaeon]|nr:heavy-metal-associated domain-containing protein [Candidatus Pacearchaeota archaeon]
MTRKIKLLIEGMHCASCASNVEKSLKKVQGVEKVNVNILTHKGIVEADERVEDEDLRKAVARAGYTVLSIE